MTIAALPQTTSAIRTPGASLAAIAIVAVITVVLVLVIGTGSAGS